MGITNAPTVTVPRLLAAGQKGENLTVKPFYGPCLARDVPFKGRGLVASEDVAANGVLLLEPSVASGATVDELATKLVAEVETGGGDANLLRQLLSLCRWGEAPSEVQPIGPSDEESTTDPTMKRQTPFYDADGWKAAKSLVPGVPEGCDGDDWRAALNRCMQSACQANAFRGAVDALGGFAWQTLSAEEQRAVAASDPSKVPVSQLSLFLRASLMNHSERPNASWLVAGGCIVVRAARALTKGEEVLVSYWPDIDAADARAMGLPEGYGMTQDSVGDAKELGLSAEQLQALTVLKGLPMATAERLQTAGGGGGDAATVFDAASAELDSGLREAGNLLPKMLVAFLEPRVLLSQLILQQAAAITARGDAKKGEALRTRALVQMRVALNSCDRPWNKRVLLRVILALKGVLRPAPAVMLGVCAGASADAAGAASADRGFSICLAKQARASPADLRMELESAVRDVFGDEQLAGALLSITGVAPQE